MNLKYEVRPGAYYDSVVLMQLQKALVALPGVDDAGAVMATEANRDLMAQSGLLPETDEPFRPDDLLIAVRADTEAQAQDAINQIDELLKRRRSTEVDEEYRPKSLDAAADMLPDSRWVLISVPGQYAARVAEQSLNLGKHVFLYSDNVSMEDEIRLKEDAYEKGLLVMGPDCGTAIVNGIGLGFANRVRQGNIGLVGASGTGLQAITARIHMLGGGVSHAIGTGGRDLKDEVGGITAIQALGLLRDDPDTKVIVVVSKPPSAAVAAEVIDAARHSNKPVVINFIGYAPPGPRIGKIHFAGSLGEAANLAVWLAKKDGKVSEAPKPATRGRYVRGIYSGGTLALEATRALSAITAPVYANFSVPGAEPLESALFSKAHTIVDFGEDEFTQGRLHPMMDNTLRVQRIEREAADPEVAVLLIDVVLGEGAHSDPASELAPAISDAIKFQKVAVVVVLVGTDEDPQDIKAQHKALKDAGAIVFNDTMPAIEYVAALLPAEVANDSTPVSPADLNTPLAAINVGLESFYDSLIDQEAEAVHVEWRPPAGGDEKLMSILDRMRKG